ncbi:lysophospholipid acyltransferase family protein [Halothiobacillus sp. DCM-1]|uniref:lysophospholipid acyltransferase family protein n=1 Tax=Halothiobacillus sp. DCM-1 TaxID=3112558 RepID=UPI00324B1223
MRRLFPALLRLFRLLGHFAQGLWLTYTRAHRSAEQQTLIVQRWLAAVPGLIGVEVRHNNPPPSESGGALWVANHISWLDIPLLGGLAPGVVFLAKEEIRRWPIIGALATGAGTQYLQRGRGSEAAYQAITAGLASGKRVVIFPEGTTTRGDQVRRFHPRLFQAVLDHPAPIQPIAIRYQDASGSPARSAAYIDDDSFLGSLWRVLTARQLVAEVVFLPPQSPAMTRDSCATQAEQAIRAQRFPEELPPPVNEI